MTPFDALVPTNVAMVHAPSSATPGPLFADEEIFVARAVEKRRREFALGRTCARRALVQLGASAPSLPAAHDRAPIWPAGVVGSITHSEGLVVAAVAWRADLRGLGIDVESASALPGDVRTRVCVPAEQAWLAARGDASRWGVVLFSAKESVYKCVTPAARIELDFVDVAIAFEHEGTFTARSPRLDLTAVRGRWAVTPHHVLTAATWCHGGGQPQ